MITFLLGVIIGACGVWFGISESVLYFGPETTNPDKAMYVIVCTTLGLSSLVFMLTGLRLMSYNASGYY